VTETGCGGDTVDQCCDLETMVSRLECTRVNFVQVSVSVSSMGGVTGVCGGQCPPLLGPAGYRGYRGRSNENDLCFYSRQSLFSIVQVTEFQLVIVNLVIVNLYSAFM